jgi:hypothetical protein
VKKDLSRRDLLGRAGLMVGGAVTLGALSSCSNEDDPCPVAEECPAPVDTAAKLKDFPYEKHVAESFTLDAAAVQEAAYHGYYAAAPGGGCGHGAYSALLADLARAGNPFDQLPTTFGQFGFGGIVGYGSTCGAVLGSVLIVNSVIADATARNNMIATLMRWYETHEFPAYAPATVDPVESGATMVLNWGSEPGKPAVTKVAPGSHLCHASVSGWCAAQDPMVNAGGASQPDKKARCARVTADVAGKTVEMVNAYLASGALGARSFAIQAPGSDVTGCTTCHGTAVNTHQANSVPPAASGMSCPACHTEKLPLNGATHAPAATTCGTCHAP